MNRKEMMSIEEIRVLEDKIVWWLKNKSFNEEYIQAIDTEAKKGMKEIRSKMVESKMVGFKYHDIAFLFETPKRFNFRFQHTWRYSTSNSKKDGFSYHYLRVDGILKKEIVPKISFIIRWEPIEKRHRRILKKMGRRRVRYGGEKTVRGYEILKKRDSHLKNLIVVGKYTENLTDEIALQLGIYLAKEKIIKREEVLALLEREEGVRNNKEVVWSMGGRCFGKNVWDRIRDKISVEVISKIVANWHFPEKETSFKDYFGQQLREVVKVEAVKLPLESGEKLKAMLEEVKYSHHALPAKLEKILRYWQRKGEIKPQGKKGRYRFKDEDIGKASRYIKEKQTLQDCYGLYEELKEGITEDAARKWVKRRTKKGSTPKEIWRELQQRLSDREKKDTDKGALKEALIAHAARKLRSYDYDSAVEFVETKLTEGLTAKEIRDDINELSKKLTQN